MIRLVLLFFLILFIFLGCHKSHDPTSMQFTAFDGAANMTNTELAERVDVREVDFFLVETDAGVDTRPLWDVFAHCQSHAI